MRIKKKTLFLLGTASIACMTIPFVATSCGQSINTTNGRIVTKDFATKMYSNLSSINSSIESLAYGSNYNNGNYVFVYGTTADSSFRNFLYGLNGNDGSGNDKKEELNLSSSPFIQKFFDYGSLGGGQLLNYNVSLILYVDVAPYNGNAGVDYNGLDGINSPFDKFTIDEVITEANGDIAGKYDAKTLPEKYRYKVNTYKRNDEQARIYRDFIAYIKSIRPNGGFSDTSGMIAFRNKTTPQKLEATDTSYDSLVTYYTKGQNVTNPPDNGDDDTTNPDNPDNGNNGDNSGGENTDGDTNGNTNGGDNSDNSGSNSNGQSNTPVNSNQKSTIETNFFKKYIK